MSVLENKKIVLGLTGGIAAYKAPELVRRLKEHGADIRVVVTESAKAFVTPLSLQAVSGNSVSDSLLDTEAELAMGHIELAKWADLILVAPATANTIAKITHGLADDLLTTICLATDATISIAPAMNQQMWHAKVTQENIQSLKNRSIFIWGPGKGEQACGDVGLGRMLDVPDLVEHTLNYFSSQQPQSLVGQHWVITAGPTREAIDPVRYITNHSSGKMGYAIAEAARALGAKITIISGPVNIPTPQGCEVECIESADQMLEKSLTLAPSANVFIGCAAVADYRIANVASEKIKKSDDKITLNLIKNPDVIAKVAALANKPFMVGFAAETQNVEQYALGKLQKKNLDLIAANDVAKSGQGFNSNKNALTVFGKKDRFNLELASKDEIAKQLVDIIIKESAK